MYRFPTTTPSVNSPAALLPAFLFVCDLGGLLMCACCGNVFMIKMTCVVNKIIARDRRAEPTSLSYPELAKSKGQKVFN